jgi:hypothetical protein
MTTSELLVKVKGHRGSAPLSADGLWLAAGSFNGIPDHVTVRSIPS